VSVAGLFAAMTAIAPSAGAAAAGDWNPGKHDEDVIQNCWTGADAPGVSADVGWRSLSGEVPRVGEIFYVRAYAGLVGLPCSQSGVAVLPEMMLPNGVVLADDKAPIYWDLTKSGTSQQLKTTQLTGAVGRNGGLLIGDPSGLKWQLRQGDVLELQLPVIATRTLIGSGTQAPECQSRRDGTAPCPIAQSGDHFQMAFTVAGHDGNKSYVTPYVGLFAQAANGTGGGAGTGGGSGTGIGGGAGSGTGQTGGTGTGGTTQNGGQQAGAAVSTTSMKLKASRRAVKAKVTIASSAAPNGTLTISDKGRTIATAKVTGSTVTVKLPRLERGKHVLVAAFSGGTGILGSASASQVVRVR
jgi:hypothetical protein